MLVSSSLSVACVTQRYDPNPVIAAFSVRMALSGVHRCRGKTGTMVIRYDRNLLRSIVLTGGLMSSCIQCDHRIRARILFHPVLVLTHWHDG